MFNNHAMDRDEPVIAILLDKPYGIVRNLKEMSMVLPARARRRRGMETGAEERTGDRLRVKKEVKKSTDAGVWRNRISGRQSRGAIVETRASDIHVRSLRVR